MYQLPVINAKKEKGEIVNFIQKTLKEQNIKNVVVGVSGGIDSVTSFYLLKEAVPSENIFVAHLYYSESLFKNFESSLKKANIPTKNIYNLSIKSIVDEFKEVLNMPNENNQNSKIRLGNIMARVRMTMLYDLAKKNNALVLGTENKSEYYLGYFTRFGDEASDIEPIRHLYKTQVYQLARNLSIPQNIIEQKPTAGLWAKQTDEGEFGFPYKEADVVLYLYYDKKLTIKEIKKMSFPNTEKIINFSLKNSFKHHAPYIIK